MTPDLSTARRARLCDVLRTLGAPEATRARADTEAADLAEQAWSARVLVTIDGRITTLLGADENGYLVDLASCRDYAQLGILAAA